MTNFAADDFAYIAARQRELADDASTTPEASDPIEAKAMKLYSDALAVAPADQQIGWNNQADNIRDYWRRIARAMPATASQYEASPPTAKWTLWCRNNKCRHEWQSDLEVENCPRCGSDGDNIPF